MGWIEDVEVVMLVSFVIGHGVTLADAHPAWMFTA
jgi:hypothetical protein